MKKIIILLVFLPALSLFCAAQGSVNNNNGLGTPYGETQNPYSQELSDYTTMTDTMPTTNTAPALLKDSPVTDAAKNTDVTAAIAIIAVIAVITVAAIAAYTAMRRKEN